MILLHIIVVSNTMRIDAVILCSFMSIVASPVIFSLFLFPLPFWGSANLFIKSFRRESKTLLWFYAETAEKRSSKRLREKRHQTILLIKICGGKATAKCVTTRTHQHKYITRRHSTSALLSSVLKKFPIDGHESFFAVAPHIVGICASLQRKLPKLFHHIVRLIRLIRMYVIIKPSPMKQTTNLNKLRYGKRPKFYQ